VCYATDDDEPGSEWTNPCRCRGATKWVHQICLQQWIDEKQHGASSVKVSCPQCQFTYRIEYPGGSVMLWLYEYANRTITFCSPMILAGITASSLYWISFTYGVTAVSIAMGRERAIEFFSNPDSSLTILTLPLLPWTILAIKLMQPEVQILKFWYRFVSPTLYYFLNKFPLTKSLAPETSAQRRFMPAPLIGNLPFLCRCVVGTVSLPIISAVLGCMLSYVIQTSNFKKTLIVSWSNTEFQVSVTYETVPQSQAFPTFSSWSLSRMLK